MKNDFRYWNRFSYPGGHIFLGFFSSYTIILMLEYIDSVIIIDVGGSNFYVSTTTR